MRLHSSRRRELARGHRRGTRKRRGMQIEMLERREVFATITGGTAPGGFEALNSAAINYWLNASAIAQGNNTLVAAWNNSATAAANNFTQATGVKQPLLQTAALGPSNLPAVRFDGDISGHAGTGVAPNSDELVLANSATTASIFIVNSTTSSNGLDGIWGQNNADTGIRRQSAAAWQHPGNGNDFTNPGALYVNGVAGTNPAAALGVAHVLSAVRPTGSTYPQTNLGDYFQVGTNTPRAWGGLVGDVLAFNRTVTDAERIVIENSLAAKYGITLSSDFYLGDATGYGQNVFGIGATGQINNIALGKTATQSTDHGAFPASNGVNGNLGDFTHTNGNDNNASWQVDLGSNTAVDQVTLFNRGDGCCQYRLRDITVQVFDASNTLVYTSPVLNPGNSLNGPATIVVNPGVAGRFVKVSRASLPGGGDDNNVLSLGEVQVVSTSVLSAGNSGFGIEAAAGALTAGEYVMAGYKSVTNALVTTDLAPGISQRFGRAWFVDKTGSVDAKLAFDFSDAGLGAPAANISSYRLLYSPNNNFEASEAAFQVLGLTPTVTGDTITFAVPDGSLLDGYYTLGLREVPTVVYVDDGWTGFSADAQIVDADGGTAGNQGAAFGYNAFATISSAIAAVGAGTTIVVNDGTYNETASLDNSKTLRLTGLGAGTSTVSVGALNSGAGTTVDLQANALSVGSSNTSFTLAGTIQGSGALTKVGTGQISLNGASTYSGGTTISAGRAFLGNATGFGTGTINVGAGTYVMLWFNTGSATITNNWVLNGIGGSQLGEQKDAIYSDGAGGGFSNFTLAGNIQLAATSNIGGHNSNNITITGQISGPGGLTKGGTRGDENNTVILSNPLNNYAGPTTVVQGTLATGANEAIPNTSVVTVDFGKTLALGTFAETIAGLNGAGAVTKTGSSSPLTINNTATAAFAGVISGGGGLTKLGAGTQYLGGANTYDGNTTIAAGTLKLISNTAIPDGAGKGNVIVNGTLDLGEFSETINSLAGSGSVISSTSAQLTQKFFNLDAESGVGVGKTYTHLLDFVADTGAARVNGVPFTISGATGANWNLAIPTALGTIGEGSGGTIPTQLDDLGMERLYRDFYYTAIANPTGTTSVLTLSGLTVGEVYEMRLYIRQWTAAARVQSITFDSGSGPSAPFVIDEDANATPSYLPYRYTATSPTMAINITAVGGASFHFYGASNEVYRTPTLTVGDATSTTFSGVIGGPTTVVKQGAGTLTLSGANMATGPLTVNGGTLSLTGSVVSPITVSSGATLAGTGTVNAAVTINALGTLSPGAAAGASGVLTVVGPLTVTGSYAADIGTTNDRVNVTGAVNLTGSSLNFNLLNLPHAPGTPFVLIANDAADPVTGAFAGLAEGDIISVGGDDYRITYTFDTVSSLIGAGNDVALVRNDDLLAADDAFTMLQGTSLTATVADNDVDNDVDNFASGVGDGVYSIDTDPAHGSVTIDPVTGEFTYTPAPNFLGTDSFVYRLADSEADFDETATVTITVTNIFVDDTGTLFVNGSSAGDRIVLQTSSNGSTLVRFNNKANYVQGVSTKIIVFGQGGPDTITVSGNLGVPIELYGGAGNDYLAGSSSSDLLDGGEGTDRLLGGGGDDFLYGGGGNDTISGGVGNDLVDGDRSYDISATNEIGDLVLGANQGRDNLGGDAGNDVLIGWGNIDTLAGAAGNDLLIGGALGDGIKGGLGDDLLYGGDLSSSDDSDIAPLADAWFAGDVDAVLASLTLLGETDAGNTLNGEGGADLYLLWLLDKIALPAEKKLPNVLIPLYTP